MYTHVYITCFDYEKKNSKGKQPVHLLAVFKFQMVNQTNKLTQSHDLVLCYTGSWVTYLIVDGNQIKSRIVNSSITFLVYDFVYHQTDFNFLIFLFLKYARDVH